MQISEALVYILIIFCFFSQVHDNEYTMKAAATLRACLSTRCCPTGATYTWWDQTKNAGECFITTSHFGETETDYDEHDGEDV